jgi:uncharacterized protein (DUF305 family)
MMVRRPTAVNSGGHTVAAFILLGITAAAVGVTTHRLGADSGSPAGGPERSPAPLMASATLNATDVAFIELMIPMNEHALPLLDVLTTDRVTSLRNVASALGTTYRAEVTTLRAALAADGVVEQDPHAGMDMPGFITQAQLARISSSTGAGREAAARDALCAHLNQSLVVARGELTAGNDAATRTIATVMVATRSEYLATVGCIQPTSE